MINVSTKTGDKGKTSLANGQRVSKSDSIFGLIGTLDELNSHLGLVRAKLNKILAKQPKQELILQEKNIFKIQKQLFVLGGYVAKADIKLFPDFLKKIEQESNKLQQLMAADWHSRFVLPGGHEVAADLDIARSVCRRLERECVAFINEHADIDELLLQTINRLSDYLYVLRCFVNEEFEIKEYYV